MQLYKSRGFGEFFQDTFTFLRQNGKHFFKHFLIVNGLFLLILMAMGYFFSKIYTDVIFGGMITGNQNGVDSFMNQNSGYFLLLFMIFLIVGLFAAAMTYSFVPIYLKLYTEKDGKQFSASDLIKAYKSYIGKIFVFIICGIIVAIPLFLLVGLVTFILTITIIGMLLLPIVFGAVSLYYQGTLMEYLNDKKGIWESFSYSWKLMSSKFWPAIGCVGIFYLMSYIAQNVVILIPYLLYIVDMITNIETGSQANTEEIGKSLMMFMLIILFLTFTVVIFLNLIVQLNQGVIFYSLKEDIENINTKSDIDLIGTSE